MFQNEPLTDFTIAKNREEFAASLKQIDDQIRSGAFAAKPIINGKEVTTAKIIDSVDPASPSTIVGKVFMASEADTEQALQSVLAGAPAWDRTSPEIRAQTLRNAAARMRKDKARLSAIIVREGGKPWKEADADVAEAIDFCDYYAEEMVRLSKPRKTAEVPAEENYYFYQPRGVCLVIAPWNFPLAIACGMTTAALVTGNGTILKPSNQTAVIAYEMAKILFESGVPGNAFAFLPGAGGIIGRKLVESPFVDMICFTGSKAVGLEIMQKAAEVKPGQKNIKRVIAELGGKNAVVVDSDADLDDAVKGVLYSAFGYAGQKCSACSRAIIVGDAYEPFIERLCDAASDILVGKPTDPATLLGPVIDKESQQRILATIAQAEKTEKLAFKGTVPSEGYFAPATIFRDVDTKSTLWTEEIFGPVLACTKAKDFQDAIRLANDCQYALTGGVFSRSPKNIEIAKKEFRVGNLYINRGCTGALVCRHPFGGFKMSGMGSKAGGPDYLLQFMEPRTVTENTLRRGFSPE